MVTTRQGSRMLSTELTGAEEGTPTTSPLPTPRPSRKSSANGFSAHAAAAAQAPLSKDLTLWDEAGNLLLLVTLYMMQGVPLGLTMGSMPFLLQSNASYTQIGFFSIAAYPYSFKLLWSPIVDSVYSTALGRRKSWIIPMQGLSAMLMIGGAAWLEGRLQAGDIMGITLLFFVAVLLAATQDIAVDGWALTLLSKRNIGWASTCQTVGMNIGYFLSFTVFLAFNDPSFCNAYIRSAPAEVGVLTLAGYVRFWGWAFLIITAAVALFKAERPVQLSGEAGALDEQLASLELTDAYASLWGVVKLPAVQRLAVFLLTCRIGMLPAESAAPLKLLEKGVSKEALAGLVLLEFPCELISAFLAGRWATTGTPSGPWLLGYRLRLLTAVGVTALVARFPLGASSLQQHPGYFAVLAVLGLVTSFTSTLMFTALGSLYTKISDPSMGGAYLTLLNTISNMGVILPKLLVFWLMDALTVRACVGAEGQLETLTCPSTRSAATASNMCTQAGGTCEVVTDGFYMLSYAAVACGALLSLYFGRELPALEKVPLQEWRAVQEGELESSVSRKLHHL